MAEEQDSANDIGEGADAPEISDYEDTTTTAAIEYTTTTVIDDYDDGPIEDYVVKLVVDEQSNGVLSPELADALATDIYGNTISPITTLNGYTTAIYDELNANSTAITGGKRWWGKFVKQKFGEKKKKKSRHRSICLWINLCMLLRQAKITSKR
jgi:hypothetical protein